MIQQLISGDPLITTPTSVDAILGPDYKVISKNVLTLTHGTRCLVHNPQRVVCWDTDQCRWVDGITINLVEAVAKEIGDEVTKEIDDGTEVEIPIGPYLVPLEAVRPDED